MATAIWPYSDDGGAGSGLASISLLLLSRQEFRFLSTNIVEKYFCFCLCFECRLKLNRAHINAPSIW